MLGRFREIPFTAVCLVAFHLDESFQRHFVPLIIINGILGVFYMCVEHRVLREEGGRLFGEQVHTPTWRNIFINCAFHIWPVYMITQHKVGFMLEPTPVTLAVVALYMTLSNVKDMYVASVLTFRIYVITYRLLVLAMPSVGQLKFVRDKRR